MKRGLEGNAIYPGKAFLKKDRWKNGAAYAIMIASDHYAVRRILRLIYWTLDSGQMLDSGKNKSRGRVMYLWFAQSCFTIAHRRRWKGLF